MKASRRLRWRIVSAAAIALLLAACSQPSGVQSSFEVQVPAGTIGVAASALSGWTAEQGLTVEVLGTGLGNAQSATDSGSFAIPDPSTVVKVYVQVVTKSGSSGVGDYPDPTDVVITALDAGDIVIDSKSFGDGVDSVAIESQDGASGTVGLSHEAEFDGEVATIEFEISDNATTGFPQSPRSLIVTVFRDLGSGSSSAGVLPNLYAFGNDEFPDAMQSVPLPAGFPGGDITVTFAISDLEMFSSSSGFTDNDPRIIHYEASAGGVTANGTIDQPNQGADLAIVQLTLNDVPAGTSEVDASIYSPSEELEDPEGDSVYFNTVNLTITSDERGFEGCTPGYWRQEHHFDSWTDYTPDQLFSDVFDRVITVRTGGRSTKDNPTMLQAVWANGGGVNALARHAVAALLNTSSAGVDYPYTTAEVIAMVQAQIDSGEFDHEALAEANELGCGLN